MTTQMPTLAGAGLEVAVIMSGDVLRQVALALERWGKCCEVPLKDRQERAVGDTAL